MGELLACLLGVILGVAWLAGRQSAKIVTDHIKELDYEEAMQVARNHGRTVRIIGAVPFILSLGLGCVTPITFGVTAMLIVLSVTAIAYVCGEMSQLDALWQTVEQRSRPRKSKDS